MPKPPYTYRHEKRQSSIPNNFGQHHRELAVDSAKQWNQFYAVLEKAEIDEPRLMTIKQLFNKLAKRESLSKETQKLCGDFLKKVRDVAEGCKTIARLDQDISTHSQTILRVPPNVGTNLGYVTNNYTLLTAYIHLVMAIEMLLKKKWKPPIEHYLK